MLPPDMMSAAPAGGGMAPGLPPDLMAMLAGGGGGEAPMDPGMEPPMEEPAAPGGVTDGAPGGSEDALVQVIDLLQVAIDAEGDQEDVQILLQCQTKLQAVLARNQKEADAALGGNITPKAIRRMA